MYCYMLQQQHENIHSSKIYLYMMTTAKKSRKKRKPLFWFSDTLFLTITIDLLYKIAITPSKQVW